MCFCSFWCFNNPAPCSTVTAVWTGPQIVIGADSRETDEQGHVMPNPVCKILPLKTVGVWASAQVYRAPVAKFDIGDLIERVAGDSPRSLRQVVYRFDKVIEAELRRAAKIVKSKDPTGYAKAWRRKHVLEIIFAGRESTTTVLFYRDYWLDPQDELMSDVYECPSFRCPGPRRACLGFCDEIAERVKLFPPWDRNGIVEGTRELIQSEINTHIEVGPPIDVLTIDLAGAQRIGQEPQSKCPPITPQ